MWLFPRAELKELVDAAKLLRGWHSLEQNGGSGVKMRRRNKEIKHASKIRETEHTPP